MTPAESKALEDVRRILREHFPAYVLTIQSTDENLNDRVDTFFTGNRALCLGLAHICVSHVAPIAGAVMKDPDE